MRRLKFSLLRMCELVIIRGGYVFCWNGSFFFFEGPTKIPSIVFDNNMSSPKHYFPPFSCFNFRKRKHSVLIINFLCFCSLQKKKKKMWKVQQSVASGEELTRQCHLRPSTEG